MSNQNTVYLTLLIPLSLFFASLGKGQVITVSEQPDSSGPGGDGQFLITSQDIQKLATVVANDPLRSVQAIPGVTSDNDFEARFSLRGADFSRIGVYLDGILLHNPIHSMEGTDLSGSAGFFNASALRAISLNDDIYSERFADSSAAVLDVAMRDGKRDGYHLQLNFGLAQSGVQVTGPVTGKCSWIGAFRKSYIQYLISRELTDPSMAFGLQDEQGRLSCQISRSDIVTLDLIGSNTTLDRTSVRNQLGANDLMLVDQPARVANLGWIFTPQPNLLITSHLAWIADSFQDLDAWKLPLGNGSYREWAGNSNLTWSESQYGTFEAGFDARSRRAGGFSQEYDRAQDFELRNNYAGGDLLTGGYLSQSWTAWGKRLHFTASGRWDHDSVDRVSVLSPQAGITLGVVRRVQLSLGWGQYTQFPDMTQLGSNLGGARLLPMRSTHVTAAMQFRFKPSTILRIEGYERFDRDLLDQPYYDPRMLDGRVLPAAPLPLYDNSLRGTAKGVEVYLARQMGSRVSGWVSYAYGKTWMQESVTGDSFPSDWDQRHTVNAYVSYTIRPSFTVSAKFTYGSGFPVPGYLTMIQDQFYLTDRRNTFRLDSYARLDLRANKSWRREKWTTTLFAEVLNAANRTNLRFGSLDWYSLESGLAVASVDQMFPILPAVGVVIER